MNFINNDPDHIEVLESKITSTTTANTKFSTTDEVYSFNGKLNILHVFHDTINSISDNDLMA